ncbi:unnamed protein product [Rhizophagus irregularis]|nr:unnamed protein product [Rhizophagus irregularis]
MDPDDKDYINYNYNHINDRYEAYPDNRPGSVEIKELIYLFYNLLNGSCRTAQEHHYEIRKQFEQTQEHRKENLLMIESNQLTTHTQVIYTSRLLNPFTSK